MTRGPLRPAIVEGALALEHGWDPLRYLDLVGVDRLIAKEILQEAVERRADRDQRFWKNAVGAVQSGVARAFKGGGK